MNEENQKKVKEESDEKNKNKVVKEKKENTEA